MVYLIVSGHKLSRLKYNHPPRLVGNRKYTICGFLAYFVGIITESFSCLLRNEDEFLGLSTFRCFKDQFLILKVPHPELQYLSDPHPTSGHQFEQ
jgi:hypothetical protein